MWTFPDLLERYLCRLDQKPSGPVARRVARQWLTGLTEVPTRAQVLARQRAKCPQDFAPGATAANKELSLLRSACRWGLYEEQWVGGDPTVGIRKRKTKKRKRIGKYEELRTILHALEFAATPLELRNRVLFGLELYTGCRPSEARTALRCAITPYGEGGCWHKGQTKTGEEHEIPLPPKLMGWLATYQTVRHHLDPRGQNPYLFPGLGWQQPLAESTGRDQWAELCRGLQITGLWNYDLRRTLASTLHNDLHYDEKTIQAILNHYDGRALSHYVHVSFDALVPVIHAWAEWLEALKGGPYVLDHSPAPTRSRWSGPPGLQSNGAAVPVEPEWQREQV